VFLDFGDPDQSWLMRDRLLKAQASGSVVCIRRVEIEGGRELGEVVAVGAKWFLYRIISDSIYYDGFGAMRIANISQMDHPHRFAKFVARALKLRHAAPPSAPPLALDSAATLLETACDAARLVSIHWEEIDAGECAVGKFEGIDEGEFSFREVSPAAKWNRDLAIHEFRHLTRVDLLRGYEEALADVLFEPES
jgi:hypothetical protein